MEDQPLPADASSTALSPGYVVDSYLEKDEKDPKKDPAYYPADRGNNDDDESSNDDDDDDDVEKDEEDKEEEEHQAPADPSDVSTDDLETMTTVNQGMSIEEIERVITPVNNNQAFTSPPSSNALINFVNELGYPKLVRNLSNVVTNDMFQPWRALTTIINLYLMVKTSRFERPRAHVLQILWGVVTQAYIDYGERIWEAFTQSIHTFIEDKRNLAQHTYRKKKATLIVIPSIRFTKLIIYHLQRKHKFHLRPDSLLHLPNEEPVLGYLKFSAKGTKREVFGMPIPGSLITEDLQGASYYQEYLAKVAKHK
nr:E-beta-farnesene synthase [Tanacetum cinerariifolium]